jgi:hypothetical protein
VNAHFKAKLRNVDELEKKTGKGWPNRREAVKPAFSFHGGDREI